MIVLDTNVVSEAMRPSPDAAVVEWLNETDSAALYLTTITIAEISYGVQMLAERQRRDALSARFAEFMERGFTSRILSFDEDAAWAYGDVMATRKRLGRPISVPDGQIAAIARTHQCAVATRHAGGFAETGVELINPWEA